MGNYLDEDDDSDGGYGSTYSNNSHDDWPTDENTSPAMSKWRPMSVAPTDGTGVIAFRMVDGRPEVSTAYFNRDRNRWCSHRSIPMWCYPDWAPPTHWMPLSIPSQGSTR